MIFHTFSFIALFCVDNNILHAFIPVFFIWTLINSISLFYSKVFLLPFLQVLTDFTKFTMAFLTFMSLNFKQFFIVNFTLSWHTYSWILPERLAYMYAISLFYNSLCFCHTYSRWFIRRKIELTALAKKNEMKGIGGAKNNKNYRE